MKIFSQATRLLILSGVIFGVTAPLHSQPLVFTTLAGYAGDGAADGAGATALFQNPGGVAVDGLGNVYVADSGNNTIRIVTSYGTSITLAGVAGVTGSVDGMGTNALFNHPEGIALDAAGDIYVADSGNDTIRKITTAGQVSTVAGSAGVIGSGNATGTNALFFQPMGIAVDGATNLYVADYGNDLIRKITSSGVVSTLAGSPGNFGSGNGVGGGAQFYQPEGVAVDQAGNVFVADTGNAAIREITPAGAVTTVAGSAGSLGSANANGTNALFFQPAGIAVDGADTLYIADYFNNSIRELSSAGVVTTLAGSSGVSGSADGSGATARFWGPQGIAVAATGLIYVADTGNSAIRVITPSGVVSTLAGSPSDGSTNGATTVARFFAPQSVAVDGSGNIYVADTQNSIIRKITSSGIVSTLAGLAGTPGSADGSGTNALFSAPQGIAVDLAGNIYVADTQNSSIRKITPSGTVSTLAGFAGNPGNADGTGAAAQFNAPEGIAVDGNNTIYVADTENDTIREVTSGGVVTTLAGMAGSFGSADGTNSNARFNRPTGVTVGQTGNLYVSDYNNDTIREVTPSGVVSTVAGWAGISGSADGTNGSALFSGPSGIAVDSSGNIYVTDSRNSILRKITTFGTNWLVNTVAGSPGISGSLDGAGATFNDPEGVATGSAGYIYVADSGNNTIRSQTVAPSIITEPQSLVALNGTPATFNVVVAGSSPLTYVWSYNGVSFSPGTSSITVTNAGSYSVTASNSAGSVSSDVVTLTLTNSAAAAGMFQSISAQPNGAVQFSLTGTPGAAYTLDVSTNLTDWTPLVTLTLTNGPLNYTDSTASNSPSRFYRLVH